jgi:phage terminase Nu1 subunit (DNA packaging protein)
MNSEVLNSWKEIAAYMGRGVRTVQRWERELGLPVRRPRAKQRSAVIALTTDLERWLHKVPQGTLNTHASTDEKREKLHLSTERLLRQVHHMVEQSNRMQEIAKTTVVLTSKLRERQSQRAREQLLVGGPRIVVLSQTSDLSSRVAGSRAREVPLSNGQAEKGSANSA